MSGVARKMKTVVEMPDADEMPSTMHVNMKKHAMPDKHKKVGAMVHMRVKAKVTGINEDQYGRTMRMEVHHIEHEKEAQ